MQLQIDEARLRQEIIKGDRMEYELSQLKKNS